MESDNLDDDYLSRLLAFMWRFRLLCAAIILAGAIIGPFRHRQTFPFRTTLSLRLVSPSVGYKHGDFWVASGKAWLTELTTVAAKSSTPQLQLSVLTARDPWQLTVVALHSATEGVEGTLLQVVENAGQLLHPGEGPAEIFDPKFVMPVRAAKNSRGLMAELRYHLTELEKLLGNSSGGRVPGSMPLPANNAPQFISGNLPSVPVQSIPYYPWYERLHVQACWHLADAVSAGEKGTLGVETERAIASHLERASILISQVWFSMDPLNPVYQLPEAQVQSLTKEPDAGEPVLRSAALGAWFAVVVACGAAMIGEWFSRNWSRVFGGN